MEASPSVLDGQAKTLTGAIHVEEHGVLLLLPMENQSWVTELHTANLVFDISFFVSLTHTQ